MPLRMLEGWLWLTRRSIWKPSLALKHTHPSTLTYLSRMFL